VKTRTGRTIREWLACVATTAAALLAPGSEAYSPRPVVPLWLPFGFMDPWAEPDLGAACGDLPKRYPVTTVRSIGAGAEG
jgi:hypothetical protein